MSDKSNTMKILDQKKIQQQKIIKNNGYKATESYIEKYYKFPSFLIQNEKYSKMSDSAKITYMLFKNEFRRSIHENWVDSDGILYFEFTQADLMSKLNCYQGKVKSIIEQLEKFDLILIDKGEFNPKKKKNEKNKYYLLKPEVTADDIFIQSQFEKSVELERHLDSVKNIEESTLFRDAKTAHRNVGAETLDNTGNAKIARRNKTAETLDNTGNAKIAQEYYINKNLDTNRHLIDTEKDKLQNQIFLDNFVASCHMSQVPTFIPDKVLQLIATFSPNVEIASQTVKTIHNAKYKAQEQTGTTIVFEELEQQGINAEEGLYQTLLKAYQKNKTEKVKDIQNLIFVYVRNWFIEKPIALIQQDQNQESLPDVSMDSWLQIKK
ncbi:replication initiator protein A [Enterococcus alishanensis]